jgi:hypothetical protein
VYNRSTTVVQKSILRYCTAQISDSRVGSLVISASGSQRNVRASQQPCAARSSPCMLTANLSLAGCLGLPPPTAVLRQFQQHVHPAPELLLHP